jgi:hypothetical protein
LSSVALALDRWRSSCGRGFRIPPEIWRAAAHLASEHGVHAVSKALRLNYYTLKEHVDGHGSSVSVSKPSTTEDAPMKFVEVQLPPPAEGPMEIEVESPGGWKLRVRARASEKLDVACVLEVLGGFPG